jgi:hypothetical protein
VCLRLKLSATTDLKFYKLHYTVPDPITGNFKAIYFGGILDKFTKFVENFPIWIIGSPDNQRPDEWSSTVPTCVSSLRYIALTVNGLDCITGMATANDAVL